MSNLINNIWYVNFNIKKYIKIDDVLDIIKLIDYDICSEEKLYETDIVIKINRTNYKSYDYKCETNILCDRKLIEIYLNFKFKQIENKIKFSFDEFGDEWNIDFKVLTL
jgi:hypothetical protein